MKLLFLDPALANRTSGNQTTSLRISEYWQSLGHEVQSVSVRGTPLEREHLKDLIRTSDLILALHSGHCHEVLELWREMGKPIPLIFLVSGTDLFEPLLNTRTFSADFISACEDAHSIVTFAQGFDRLFSSFGKECWAEKNQTIFQGASPVSWKMADHDPRHAVVIGHLRFIKDPWISVRALEILQSSLRAVGPGFQIQHFGTSLDPGTEEEIRNAQKRFPGPDWKWESRGAVTGKEIRAVMSSAPLLIQPSIHEGGANVVGEFLVSGLPIIASNAPGNVGLLGEDWPGLFGVGDDQGLADLLQQWLESEEFRKRLFVASSELSQQHDRVHEKVAWERLLNRFSR